VNPRPVINLMIGDPAEMGPELCWRALQKALRARDRVLILFGDLRVSGRPAHDCKQENAPA